MTQVDFEVERTEEGEFLRRRSQGAVVAHQLLDVEILYLLSGKPESVHGIARSLASTFGLSETATTLFARTAFLKSEELLQVISSSAMDGDRSAECYTITPLGIENLSSWIDTLAEITLTMQLGTSEKLALAE